MFIFRNTFTSFKRWGLTRRTKCLTLLELSPYFLGAKLEVSNSSYVLRVKPSTEMGVTWAWSGLNSKGRGRGLTRGA
jgi:hypothetical protein